MRKRGIIWGILLLFSISIFVLFMWEDYSSKDIYNQLQEVVDVTAVLEHETAVTEEKEDLFAKKFQELYELNQHLTGWIHVEGTAIEYPVMQYKEEKDYYLHRDFEQNYSSYGVPYLAEAYDVGSSNNMIIYGHAMKNGTMFADVLKYVSYEYYEEHTHMLYFDQDGYYEYEIFAAFPIDLLTDNFDYTSYTTMSESRFEDYIKQIKLRQCYNTSITPEYGDHLITLSTCDSMYEDGRFVVVAVRK